MLYRVTTWLLAPLFAIKLGLLAAPTVIRIAYPERLRLFPLLPALVFFGLVLTQVSGKYYSSDILEVEAPASPSPTQELQTEITFWLGWYQLQPTHRDVLLHLATLYHQVGDEEKALLYLEKVREIDPNAPQLKQLAH